MKLPPSPVRLTLATPPSPVTRPQLALTVSSESAATLADFESAQVARIKTSHAEANAARREAERKRAIFRRYRRPTERTMKRVWSACKRTNGGHTFVELTQRGNWIEACKHCEMPKESKARETAITDYTRKIMIDEVIADNLTEDDLNWTPGYRTVERIAAARKQRPGFGTA